MSDFLNSFFPFLNSLFYAINETLSRFFNYPYKIFGNTLFQWTLIFASITFVFMFVSVFFGGNDD